MQRLRRAHRARHAEVDHLGLALEAHQHVGGLEVAVDHAALVAVVHRVADLRGELELARQGQVGAGGHEVARVLDVLHGDPRHAARLAGGELDVLGSGRVDARDVLVRQARQHLGLRAEAAPAGGADAVLQQLERHAPARCALLGLVDDPHAAAADDAQDAESGDLAALERDMLERRDALRGRGADLPRQEARGRGIGGEQGLDLGEQLRIAGALELQQVPARTTRQRLRALHQVAHLAPACGIHRRQIHMVA